MLKEIKIKGYKSLKDVTLNLRPINILIGANGVGKSNFIGPRGIVRGGQMPLPNQRQ